MDVTSMQWRPPLIRLTQIGNPDIDDGQPTPVFVDPNSISKISRTLGAFSRAGSATEVHERVSCTEVHCCHFHLLVTESPETVAMLRDKALGHEQKPKPVA